MQQHECAACDQQLALWEDFCDLCEKYREKLSPANFGSALIRYTALLLLGTAPQEEDAWALIQHSLERAKKLHEQCREDKEDE